MFDEESIPAESRNRVRIPIPGEKVRKERPLEVFSQSPAKVAPKKARGRAERVE